MYSENTVWNEIFTSVCPTDDLQYAFKPVGIQHWTSN